MILTFLNSILIRAFTARFAVSYILSASTYILQWAVQHSFFDGDINRGALIQQKPCTRKTRVWAPDNHNFLSLIHWIVWNCWTQPSKLNHCWYKSLLLKEVVWSNDTFSSRLWLFIEWEPIKEFRVHYLFSTICKYDRFRPEINYFFLVWSTNHHILKLWQRLNREVVGLTAFYELLELEVIFDDSNVEASFFNFSQNHAVLSELNIYYSVHWIKYFTYLFLIAVHVINMTQKCSANII